MVENIYQENGYLDVPKLVNHKCSWVLVYGGRGQGKTYGSLKYVYENKINFLFLRRLQTQIDIIKRPKYNPFKKLNSDLGIDIEVKPEGKQGINFVENGVVIGSGMALSTIANLRGFDGSDIDIIIFDEFIPERQEHPIKGEADALYNAYETINRNRELEGKPPVKLLCLSNANAIDCPLFLSLGLITRIEKMQKNHENYYQVSKDILLISMEESPIAKKKEDTVLYRITANTDYSKMALNNTFAYDDFSGIKSNNLKGYKPLVTVGEITIYKKEDLYYVSEHKSGTPADFNTNERELLQFRRKYWRLYNRYIDGKFTFENYLCKALFIKYIDK